MLKFKMYSESRPNRSIEGLAVREVEREREREN